MGQSVLILDCYTAEPSGLGVPPYLSTYVRDSFSALSEAYSNEVVYYVTIDDVRWCLNGAKQEPSGSYQRAYSATTNRQDAIKLLLECYIVVVIAGDEAPSTNLHAKNGSLRDIIRALSCVRGRRVLLGPLATHALLEPTEYRGLFDAIHTHTITSSNILSGSTVSAAYEALSADRKNFKPLLEQMTWTPIAEIELYRGCTRHRFCSFCKEPSKHRNVEFRTMEDVLHEINLLYDAGVRHFRLGQQTCFFSYFNGESKKNEMLLSAVRNIFSLLESLHIE